MGYKMFQTAFSDTEKAQAFASRLVRLNYKFEFVSNLFMGRSTYIFTYYASQELQ